MWRLNKDEALKNYGHISNWNTILITDMSCLFQCETFAELVEQTFLGDISEDKFKILDKHNKILRLFDEDISFWDVSNVTNMLEMFYGCENFNQPLNNWNVCNVINTSCMFYNCKNFNQPLNNWDVSNVTNMSFMFYNCKKFNQNINKWNVSNVIHMNGMLKGTENFNQQLNNWDVSNVIQTDSIFTQTL